MIRPYKGLGDAIEAVRRAGDARLLVAGDPLEPLEPYRAAAERGVEVEWRLGYLSRRRRSTARSEPRRWRCSRTGPSSTRAARSCRRSVPAFPAIAYDVGGIAEPVRRYGAGRVVPAGDVAALAEAVRELLSDPDALEQARAGARQAREELTWDASPQAHLAVYEEIA